MIRFNTSSARRCIVAVTIVVVAAVGAMQLWAQYRVNTRVGPVYSSSSGMSGSVRYGYTTPAVPRSSSMLPSETRNAIVRSGALPSDIRYNRYSVGGVAPRGAAAYVPSSGTVVIRDTPPLAANQWNPSAARTGGSAFATQPPMALGTTSSLATSSMRYSNVTPGMPAPSWTMPRTTAVAPTAAAPLATNAFVNQRSTFGSIHYSSTTATGAAK